MTTITKLMRQVYEALPLPAVFFDDVADCELNYAADEMLRSAGGHGRTLTAVFGDKAAAIAAAPVGDKLVCYAFGMSGSAQIFDEGVALFVPRDEPHVDDLYRVLRYAHALCIAALPDRPLVAEALRILESDAVDLERTSREAAHLLRRLSQACTVLLLIAERDEEPFYQGDVCGTIESFCRDTARVFYGTAVRVGFDAPSIGSSLRLFSPDLVLSTFAAAMGVGLALSDGASAEAQFEIDGELVMMYVRFRSDVDALDFAALGEIPQPGDDTRDLTYALLLEAARVYDGDLRYLSVGDERVLLLALRPELCFSAEAYFMREFTDVAAPVPPAVSLEYADVYNENR